MQYYLAVDELLLNLFFASFLFDSQHDDCGDARVGAVRVVVRPQCTFGYKCMIVCAMKIRCGCVEQEMLMTLRQARSQTEVWLQLHGHHTVVDEVYSVRLSPTS